MSKICYVPKTFNDKHLSIIAQANAICDEYQRQGYDLTLRQLYYQFVSRGYIPNKDTEYKRLGSIINDARLAGLLDWNYIVDRTRFLRDQPHWTSPQSILSAVAAQYRTRRWGEQPEMVEVWIEKDALVGVIQGVCTELDVPYFSCRGYTSSSEIWAAAQRHRMYEADGQKVTVIHLGDHDPSGVDMTRDIQERLWLFGAHTHVERIALTMNQVRLYDPPPNPAKITDSRATGYIEEHGYESWELDALSPDVLAELIREEVLHHRDETIWARSTADMNEDKARLEQVSTNWPDVTDWLQQQEENEDPGE